MTKKLVSFDDVTGLPAAVQADLNSTFVTPLQAARTFSAAPAQGRLATGTLGLARTDITQAARYAAFPGTTRCPDGRLLMVWREGTDHVITRDGIIVGAYSSDNGATWGAKYTVIGDGTIDYRDPSVTTLADGRIALTYFTGTGADPAQGAMVRYSTDSGATWGAASRIDPVTSFAAMCSPLVQSAAGTLLAPYYGGVSATSDAFVCRSTDGLTWGTPIKIADGVADGVDHAEPWIAQHPDGTLFAFMRHGSTNVTMSKSTDDGLTWTAPAIVFAGNGRPSAVITRNGTIVVVYRSPDAYDGRIITSTDGGVTWAAFQKIIDVGTGAWEYAGPFEVAPNVVWVPSCSETLPTAVLAGFFFLTGFGVSPVGESSGSATADPTPWIPFTYLAGWVDYGGSYPVGAYRKARDGMVELAGMIKGGATGSQALALPVGFRPPKNTVRPCASYPNGSTAFVDISAATGVMVTNFTGAITGMCLDGIRYLPVA